MHVTFKEQTVNLAQHLIKNTGHIVHFNEVLLQRTSSPSVYFKVCLQQSFFFKLGTNWIWSIRPREEEKERREEEERKKSRKKKEEEQ